MLLEGAFSETAITIDPYFFLCYNSDMPKPSILVVDDEESMLTTYKAVLRSTYAPALFTSGRDALKSLEDNHYAAAIIDLMMPEINGIELLQQIKAIEKELEVIIVTASHDVKSAVQAVKLGAFEYVTKPFESDGLLAVIEKALERRSLVRENTYLRQTLEEKAAYSGLIGKTAEMAKITGVIKKIAATDSTILITGESGTGKEIAAHTIYKLSRRANLPFIVVNCAALPDNLVEAELFGYERGAFTGALDRKAGKFELADRGTIFLDEIGCLKPALQSKLLRVIQDGSVERVGGGQPVQVDVRVIAATNLDLTAAVKSGEFREDLYYRLNVIRLHLPPLRERKDDLQLFLDFFLGKYNRDFHKRVKGFSEEAMAALRRYDWPGNVRELQNLVERVVALSEDGGLITVTELPFEKIPRETTGKNLKDAVRDFEKNYIGDALAEAGGNQTKAAEILGIHRTTLISKIDQLGLK